jgi:hypothetical protein
LRHPIVPTVCHTVVRRVLNFFQWRHVFRHKTKD